MRKEILDQMGRILREKKRMDVDFTVRFVKEIFPDPHTGKKSLILPDDMEVMAV